VVLNQLYKHTTMQSTFGIINLALVNGAPRVMPLKEMLEHFITHRHEIIVRRSQFDLAEARKREHILEGLKIAVDNIDEVIKIIRSSDNPAIADTRDRATSCAVGMVPETGRSCPTDCASTSGHSSNSHLPTGALAKSSSSTKTPCTR